MKKAIVFWGGEIHNYRKLKNYDFTNYDIFCADSGAMHAKKLNLIPRFILGDFDSIDNETLNFYKNKTEFINYPIEKNFTDGELVINKIYDSYEEILILGGISESIYFYFRNKLLNEKKISEQETITLRAMRDEKIREIEKQKKKLPKQLTDEDKEAMKIWGVKYEKFIWGDSKFLE